MFYNVQIFIWLLVNLIAYIKVCFLIWINEKNKYNGTISEETNKQIFIELLKFVDESFQIFINIIAVSHLFMQTVHYL